ncbi:MAG TPA: hypothetical protein VFP37_14030 [Steroidobacteraceae bacterium]|nr:hypothetical protein [Steroidobacteraceae bacterium]
MQSPVPFQDRLPRRLGYFGLAVGAAELIAPRLLSRVLGLRPQPTLMRAMALREIASSVGTLALPGSAAAPGSRVLGDLMDMAIIGLAAGIKPGRRGRRLLALLAVVGVTALDLYATRRLAARHRALQRHRVRDLQHIPVVQPPQTPGLPH